MTKEEREEVAESATSQLLGVRDGSVGWPTKQFDAFVAEVEGDEDLLKDLLKALVLVLDVMEDHGLIE